MRRPVPTTRGGKEPDPAPEYFRVAFDGPALAAELNTDFTAFCRKYAEYVADPAENAFSMRPSSAAPSMNMPQPPSVFYLGSYLKTPTDSILLTLCVEKDDYDNVKTITAAPEDPAKSLDVWQYCLTSAEALRLGTFLGTKYKSPSSSGVFQTIDDTLNHIAQHGTAETLACTIFGVVPQAAYAVFQLDNGAFSARLMNSYLKLDYPAMRRLGSAATTPPSLRSTTFWATRSTPSATSTSTSTMPRTPPATPSPSTYTPTRTARKSPKSTSTSAPTATTPTSSWPSGRNTPATTRTKGLGAFKEAYTTDSWGDRKETFADLAAAVAHVESNGRPGPFDGGIIVVFEADGVATNLVMNQQYIYLLIKDPNYNVE